MPSKRKTSATKEEAKPALVPKLRFPEFQAKRGWEIRALGDLATFSSGGTPSKDVPEYWNGHIPWISASSMYDTNICDSGHKVTTAAIGNGTRIAKAGSLLILTRGSMLFNRVPMGIASIDVAFNQDVRALTIDDEICNCFLMWQLISQESRIPINETGIGAGKIDTDDLRRLPVTIPPLLEQQKIAECLSSLDELIGAHGRKLDALKTHKKGLMQQLFPREGETQPRLRFPEFQNAGAWEMKSLGKIAENLDNRRVPITSSSRKAGEVPYYGASGIVDYVEGFIFDEDLLCVSEDGANLVARTYPIAFSISGKTWVNNHAHVLRFEHACTQKFVEVYLNSIKLDDYLTGMAQPKLNKAMLDRIPIPHPKVPEQHRIASCLSSLDALIAAETQKHAALQRHKRGLMQQLFPSPEEVEA
jgi:type I restriction enzyme S subunit